MKRSRTALTLFLAMLAAALQTVGVANVHRATAGDRRQCPEACTRSGAPLHDCYAQAPAGTHTLCCYDDNRYEDDYNYDEDYGYQDDYTSEAKNTYRCEAAAEGAGDHCHAQQPCGRDAYVGSKCFDGQDPCLQSYLANDRELPAYPIEEYVYGDASNHDAVPTTCRFNACDRCEEGDYGYACDEFDCCLESCRLHREDLTRLADDSRHSSGCQQAIEINQDNDGLAEQNDLPPSEDLNASQFTADSNSGYDYDDNYHRGWDFDSAVEDHRAHTSHEEEHHCTRAPGCLWSGSRHSSLAVAIGDDVPFDLPPAEAAPVATAPVAVQSSSDYGYDSYDDYNYEYGGEGYRSDYSASDYGYDEEPGTTESSPATAGADHANFGADYWNDESAFQVNDLPPGEALDDDLPPAESHADDFPPAESIEDDFPPAESIDDDLPPAEAVSDDLPPAEAVIEDDLPAGNDSPAASPRAEVYPDDFYEGEFYSNHSDCDALHRNHANVECHEVQPAVKPQSEVYDSGYEDDSNYEYNYDDSNYNEGSSDESNSDEGNSDEGNDYSDDYGYRDEVEYKSYTDYRASDDLGSAGMSDDEASWGVGQSDDESFYAEAPYAAPADTDVLRPLLRSASWLLGQMGQTLLDLSKSVEDLAAPAPASETVEADPVQTEPETYSPWPSTIGRQPGVDCPLEL